VNDIPQFYDITTDELRPVTQADVDRLVDVANAYGAMRHIMRRLFAVPEALPVDWKAETAFLQSIIRIVDAPLTGQETK
jgi:hypothetical protein